MGIKKVGSKWKVNKYVGKKRYIKTFATKDEAKTYLALIIMQGSGFGNIPSLSNKKINFKFYVETNYIKLLNGISRPDEDRRLYERLIKYWGTHNIQDITPSNIETYILLLKGKPATKVFYLAKLSKVFSLAIKDNIIISNPVHRVTKPVINNSKLNYLTRQEITKLLKIVPEHTKKFCILGVNTGMRKSEITGLTFSDIDY